jgi:penicillin-binding protein 1C
MRDNWCVGHSRRVTVGVWVGNFDGRPMRGVSGVAGAAPVWLDVMQMLPPAVAAPPDAPAGLARRLGEWFLPATAPRRAGVAAQESRIAYPGDGAILALDPDIPPAMQRVYLEATGGDGAEFFIDGARIGSAARPVPWQPAGGTHVLELRASRGGQVLDRVRFQVRGTPPGT